MAGRTRPPFFSGQDSLQVQIRQAAEMKAKVSFKPHGCRGGSAEPGNFGFPESRLKSPPPPAFPLLALVPSPGPRRAKGCLSPSSMWTRTLFRQCGKAPWRHWRLALPARPSAGLLASPPPAEAQPINRSSGERRLGSGSGALPHRPPRARPAAALAPGEGPPSRVPRAGSESLAAARAGGDGGSGGGGSARRRAPSSSSPGEDG